MYFLNQIRNPIWNFDATGSVLRSIKNQKKPYLYSIVNYDPKNKINIPFCVPYLYNGVKSLKHKNDNGTIIPP